MLVSIQKLSISWNLGRSKSVDSKTSNAAIVIRGSNSYSELLFSSTIFLTPEQHQLFKLVGKMQDHWHYKKIVVLQRYPYPLL